MCKSIKINFTDFGNYFNKEQNSFINILKKSMK